MTKFILHGGFTGADNELNRGFYREMTKGLPDGANVLLYFARKDEEVPKLFAEDKARILEQAENKNFDIVRAEEGKFMGQASAAGAIYMRGGDTDKLIETLKSYPDFKNALEGKIVSGSSAGAYVLSTYYYSATKGGVHEGLGILPLRVICHYKSEILKGHGEDAITLMEKYPHDLELVVLKDYEWREFEVNN